MIQDDFETLRSLTTSITSLSQARDHVVIMVQQVKALTEEHTLPGRSCPTGILRTLQAGTQPQQGLGLSAGSMSPVLMQSQEAENQPGDRLGWMEA